MPPLILVPPYRKIVVPEVFPNPDMFQDWKVAWKATANNYNTTVFNYTLPLDQIQAATKAAIGYYDSTQTNLSVFNMFSFDIPPEWKTQHPFTYASKDNSVIAKNERTGLSVTSTLRYGYGNFSSRLTDVWTPGTYGRIGLTNDVEAPYYTSFAHTVGDYCNLSTETYNARAATVTRRFIILVK